MRIVLDGRALTLMAPSSPSSSSSSSSEVVQDISQTQGMGSTEQDIVNESDTRGALKEITNDSIDPMTRMSGIDLRGILHPMQVNPLARIDFLVAVGFLPSTSVLHLTRQIKRLSRSIRGVGTQQMVDLAVGKREELMKLQQNPIAASQVQR